MDKLAILETNLPLKAYTPEKRQDVFENVFIIWISDLLGLTGEDAAKRLLIALPAIEKHFWSLGFNEIKKAFTMYADGELQTKPLPNYFTRILVGQIFKEYKQQKVKEIKVIEPIIISDDEKRNNEILSATICYDFYIQNGYLNNNSLYLYKVLLNKFEFSKQETETLIELSKNIDAPIEEQRLHYKKMCLRRYFDRLHAKDKHLKDVV